MKLLLAEDEKSLSRAIKIILEKNNYLVDAVYDGREALEYLEADSYDGAVLDIMMPKMDGIEVLRRIREEGNTVPVLLLTAKSQIEDKVLGLDTGANDYLTKPFDKEELLARIRAMTRVRQSQGSSVLSYGDITLNLASCELASPKGSFRLAGKEFGMMELLMRDPGTLISAEIFLERVWGYETDADINVVWVYLSYLRKKLAALDSKVRIKATRNAGYSLEVEK
ncbi:MAG: response regulator transcription factor [Oscillospiraceae bacterium]|nr:response regulator transcription factor [Oscillospiraceae bacterium]MBQ2230422.1 response regulator transcription factor [Oscillospiraceae bacterium]MBQ3986122.1 response regulator transcription factor [Oscillospiraceae bacterium]